MKITKTKLFLLLASVLWLSSCELPNDDVSPMPEPESHSCLLKTVINEFGVVSMITEFYYQRDTQLRFITETYDYEYHLVDTTNKVEWENGLIKYYYENGIEVDFEWDGKVLSKTRSIWFGEFTYTFGSDGRLSSIDCAYPPEFMFTDPTNFQFFWENGNITKIEARDSSNNLVFVDRIAYDDKNNPYTVFSYTKVALYPENTPLYLSKNMIRKLVRVTYENEETITEEVLNDYNTLYNEFNYPETILIEGGTVSLRYIECR